MTTRNTPVSVAVLAVCVWLIPAAALAQTSFGALSGKVTDEQGGFLPGATVVVRQLDTNTTRSGVTDSRGEYLASQSAAWSIHAHRRATGVCDSYA